MSNLTSKTGEIYTQNIISNTCKVNKCHINNKWMNIINYISVWLNLFICYRNFYYIKLKKNIIKCNYLNS